MLPGTDAYRCDLQQARSCTAAVSLAVSSKCWQGDCGLYGFTATLQPWSQEGYTGGLQCRPHFTRSVCSQ
jgi:hypothetical protein